jgi:hypothetical protein
MSNYNAVIDVATIIGHDDDFLGLTLTNGKNTKCTGVAATFAAPLT